MGFCRRCGDIVVGPRCRCGGAPVAPSVPWNQSDSETDVKDRWSQTYVVNRDRAQTLPSRPLSRGPPSNPSLSSQATGDRAPQTKRFPKPANSYASSSVSLGDRVSRHIANTTSELNNRPPSPLKHAITGPSPEADILPSIHTRDPTLSKVYGSVLQPKESLATHCCSVCSDAFLPDSTIYPDPSAPNPDDPTFVCRDCYTMRGGCKGLCPTCSKEVLTLKSEGGFVHAAGAYYHKKCFLCDGCGKSIGDKPMVDLLGRPCCPDCFDTCLKRESTPKKARESVLPASPPAKVTNLGGLNADAAPGRMSFPKSRESSPALQELEQRLGIASRRDSNATLEELSQRLNKIGRESPTRPSRYSATGSAAGSPRLASGRVGSPAVESRSQPDTPRRRYDRLKSMDFDSPDESPIRRQRTGSMVTDEAVEEMKRRFIKANTPAALVATLTGTGSPAMPPRSDAMSPPRSEAMSPPRSDVMSPTPDLISDVSDTATSTSGIDTPPRSDYRSLTSEREESSLSKLLGSAYTSRYNRDQYTNRDQYNNRDQYSDVLDDVIVEETRSQLNTPNRTPQRGTAAASFITSPRASITSPRASITSPRASLTSPITSPRASLTSPRSSMTSPSNSFSSPSNSFTSPSNSFTSPSNSLTSPITTSTSPALPPQGTSTPPLRIRKSVDRGLRTSLSSTSLRSSYARSQVSRPASPEEEERPREAREPRVEARDPRRETREEPPCEATPPALSSGRSMSSARSMSSLRSTSPPRSKTPRLFSPTPDESRTTDHNKTLRGSSTCDRCKGPLFGVGRDGQYVTVQGDAGNAPRVYHRKCFLCTVCDEPFVEAGDGVATYVRGKDGPCHVECSPPETIRIRTIHPEPLKTDIFSHRASHSTPPPNLQKSKTAPVHSSSRYEVQPRTAPSTQTSFPRFGGSLSCPGCQKTVSPMERGVVAGPQNTKWHGACLVCGGKKETGKGGWLSRGRDERKKGEPGCGKKLDSAAKVDANGGVWCRECSLLLNAALRASPQSSPTRVSPNVPLPSGSGSSPFPKVIQQTTGTTTLARQFTGMGGGSDPLARQTTGGGGTLPPTRSISPTKQMRSVSPSKPTVGLRPRPKSALGMRTLRNSKSVDEGRGMFLVRQLTGTSAAGA
ncbi:uncharacterized protein SCHCODRAFT_02609851 [Schizophyllum commune H4-8]|uniref:uncharacterized protein n=1 Tax=Schizophyllum commune (strain H4-8 / FGSC 9210) TaxID=578458 RepID=UPI00215FC06A|nr:uncharacterized protein SCHCODRAFT_02609851 [Schizophyllum commune H4-8]KAI5897638.1 hypothetical protein SCHCODRAFT_02609851 [Schizophyllum commune H4-8]